MNRLGRVNRWLIAGSVALTGVFTEAAASAFPGRSSSAKQAQGNASAGATTTRTSTGSANPVQAPAKAPEAVSEPSASEPSAGEASSTESVQPAESSSAAPTEETPVVSGGS